MSLDRNINVIFEEQGARDVQREAARTEKAVDRVADATKKSGAAAAAATAPTRGMTDSIRQQSLALEASVKGAEDFIKGFTAIQNVAGAVTGVIGFAVAAFTTLHAILGDSAEKTEKQATELETLGKKAEEARVSVLGLAAAHALTAEEILKARDLTTKIAEETHKNEEANKRLESSERLLTKERQKGLAQIRTGAGMVEDAVENTNAMLQEQRREEVANIATRAKSIKKLQDELDALVQIADARTQVREVTDDLTAAEMALTAAEMARNALAEKWRARQVEIAAEQALQARQEQERFALAAQGVQARIAERQAELEALRQHEIAVRDITGETVDHMLTDQEKLARARAGELADLKRQQEQYEAFNALVMDISAGAVAGLTETALAAALAGESIKDALAEELKAYALRNAGLAVESLARAAFAAFTAPAAVPTFLQAAALHGAAAVAFGGAASALGGGGGGGGSAAASAPPRPEPAQAPEQKEGGPETITLNVNFMGRPLATDRDVQMAIRQALQESQNHRGMPALPAR